MCVVLEGEGSVDCGGVACGGRAAGIGVEAVSFDIGWWMGYEEWRRRYM